MIIEAVKLAAQLLFALQAQAGLDDQQMDDLLNSERDRFKANRAKPLPDV
jgi:hypothetical protein